MIIDKLQQYGVEKIGHLKKVMLSNPEHSIRNVKDINFQFYLFDKVPDYDRFIEEHYSYRKLLADSGVEVYELSDLIVNNRELMHRLPNHIYLNDISLITRKGAILSSMCPGGRQYEELVVGEALASLGIPVLNKWDPGEQFEGLHLLFPDTLFVADTERHNKDSIERFFPFALQYFQNIIYAEIPQARRFMHPDMVFGKISDHLGLFFPPAFINCWLVQKSVRQQIDFKVWLKQRNMELIPVSDSEQQKWGTSFICLNPQHIINYDISLEPSTKKTLESFGIRFTHFHPDALLAGGGSLRCLTLCLLSD